MGIMHVQNRAELCFSYVISGHVACNHVGDVAGAIRGS